jgi:hypothetical protein
MEEMILLIEAISNVPKITVPAWSVALQKPLTQGLVNVHVYMASNGDAGGNVSEQYGYRAV